MVDDADKEKETLEMLQCKLPTATNQPAGPNLFLHNHHQRNQRRPGPAGAAARERNTRPWP
jgi:hypothetical protein